jgi:hypothetical protein
MCIRYPIAICEKDSISLWILELGICRAWRSLIVIVCVVPLTPIVSLIGDSTIHPSSWKRSGWRVDSIYHVFSRWLLWGIYCHNK